MNYNVGLIGFGYWGPNLARNIYNHPKLDLHTLADKRAEKRNTAKKQYPTINVVENASSIFSDENIKIVVIATSVNQHYTLAKKALENNKHVLVEKPAGASYEKLMELHKLAKSKNLILMVDYTFLYNGAVRKLAEIIKQEDFGNINYIDSTRINLGIFQNDVNVIWDLASHDIAIVNFLTGEMPEKISASGICHTNNGVENIAYLTLHYANRKMIVHLNCSWTSPVKIRQMLIGGDKKMIVYNDIEPTDKIKVYDCRFNFEDHQKREQVLVDYRLGDISIPKFDTTEPLAMMIEDLYCSIKNKTEPISSSEVALKVSKVIEDAQKKLKKNDF